MTRRARPGSSTSGAGPLDWSGAVQRHDVDRGAFPDLLKWDLRFIGHRHQHEVLDPRADRPLQPARNQRGLPATLLVNTLAGRRAPGVPEDLRRRVDFREMNLVKTWPVFPLMDVVFLAQRADLLRY